MSDSDEQLFDVKSLSNMSKGSDGSSMSPKRKFKRLNKNVLDSDEELFDKVEVADKVLPKKPEKQVFAKKLMKMFYDGDEEPKQKKKVPKIEKTNQKKRLKQQKQSDEESVKVIETPSKIQPAENGKRKSKRKRSYDSADFDSSVSDSVSLIPSEQDSDQYSGPRRARQNKKLRLKKKNEEKWKEYQLKYSVQEKDDDVPAVQDGKAYYTGMEFNYNYGSKKDKNAVRSRNKLFAQFQLFNPNQQQRPVQVEPIQEELTIKPRQVISKPIEEFRFMSRVSLIRKARGLAVPETQVKSTVIEQATKEIQQIQDKKAKESLMRLVTSSSISHEDNVQFELAVSLPMLTRGKSTSLFNNTLYLKKISSEMTTKEENSETNSRPMTKSSSKLTRDGMLKQMQNEIKQRRSKFISLDDIKQSFQRTDLNELQLAKERMEKKKNQAIDGFVDDKADSDYKPEEEEKEVEEDKEFKQFLALDADEDELFEDQCEESDQEQNQDQPKNENKVANEEQPQQLHLQDGQVAQNQKPLDIQEVVEAPVAMQLENSHQDNDDEPIQKVRKMQLQETPQKQQQLEQEVKTQKPAELHQAEQSDQEMESGMKQPLKSIQKTQQLDDNKQTKGMFKRLKDLAQKAHQQKLKKQRAEKIANEFLDEEAELGSDNQSNDDKKKAIDREAQQKQYQGEDLDADLQSLIDHAPYLNQSDEEQAYQKFLLDQRLKDKQQLLRVIRGEFKKSKRQFMQDIESDDEKKKEERMEEIIKKYKQREEYEDEMLYGKEEDEQQEEEDEEEPDNYIPFHQPLMRQQSSTVRSNPMELSIFSEPKSNSIGSSTVLIGLKNRGSLLSAATDKSRISTYEEVKVKSTTKSNINRLYEKNVMASKKAVMLGFKRTNSSKVE